MNNMQKSVSGAGVQLSVCRAKGPRYYHEHTYVWVLGCSLPWAEVLVDGHHRSMRTTPSQTWVDVLENQVVPMDKDARCYKVAVATLCWHHTGPAGFDFGTIYLLQMQPPPVYLHVIFLHSEFPTSCVSFSMFFKCAIEGWTSNDRPSYRIVQFLQHHSKKKCC